MSALKLMAVCGSRPWWLILLTAFSMGSILSCAMFDSSSPNNTSAPGSAKSLIASLSLTPIPTATLPPLSPTPVVTRITSLTPLPSPVRPTATPVFILPPNVAGSTTYTVEPDDTLYDIALRFDVSVDELIAINGIDDPTLLQVGQELIIPSAQRQ